MVPFIVPAKENVLIQIGQGIYDSYAQSDAFNLFVWNVYKGQHANVFEADFRSLGGGQDFILLQEAVVDQRMPKIWHEHFSSFQWNLAKSFHYKKDLSSTGVAIGSRVRPQAIDFIRAKTRELFWLTPKLTLFMEFDFGGKRALMVCTHMLNFVTLGAFTDSLYEISQKIAQFKGPVILAGDFNTWNFKRYTVMKAILRDLKLEQVDLDNDGRILKLDHVFVRGFDVLKAQVHHTVISSDHFPIELRLKIT